MGVPYAEVIGDPIAHSKSPLIHKFWLEKLGLEGDYRATRVAVSDLPDYLADRRVDPDWRGCNVTIPHKIAALSLVDGVLAAGQAAQAINTIFCVDGRLVGNNTDLRGFAEPFRAQPSRRGSALVIGTGGAARAAFVALTALGFAPIEVAGRDDQKARSMLAALGQAAEPRSLRAPLPPVDLLVNASAGSMAGAEPLAIDLSSLPPTATVYDIVYDPLETPLLASARARDLHTIDGLTMLIGQAAASFCHFFDGKPPRERDAELRELLTR